MYHQPFYKGECKMIAIVIGFLALFITAIMYILIIAAKRSDEEMEKIMRLEKEEEDDEWE